MIKNYNRIKYINNDWFIHDGDTNKESANGTWISLTDYRVKKDRIESDPKEIENESEIKISDSILKVNISFYKFFANKSFLFFLD